jgi:hypothetical protein
MRYSQKACSTTSVQTATWKTLSDPAPLRFSSDGYVDLESYFRFGH